MNRQDIVNALRAVETDDRELLDIPLTVPADLVAELIRRRHIEEAFAQPTAVRVLRHEQSELGLLTRILETTPRSVLLVVIGNLEQHWLATDAFRLYGESVDVWGNDPIEAFAEALDRYGIEFDAGGQRSRFTPFLRLPSTGDPIEAITANLKMGPGVSTRFSQAVRVVDNEVQISWAYFIDVAEHRRDVQRRRSA